MEAQGPEPVKPEVAVPAQRPIVGIKDIPTHVWLIAYYIRPDPVTVDLVKAFSGALLLSLRTGSDERPPK